MTDLKELKGALARKYKEGHTDYWMPPVLACKDNRAAGRVEDGDVFVFCCRRGEREIQLAEAFLKKDFNHFPRPPLNGLRFLPLVQYHDQFRAVRPIFKTIKPGRTLGEVLSAHRLKQLRIAESEKAPHVTYFFNGRSSESYPGQDNIIIPSAKNNFADHPECQTPQLASACLEALRKKEHSFILVNFAAGDILGHLDNRAANIAGIEAIDNSLDLIIEAALKFSYTVLITADHGVLERTKHPDGTPSISHTTAPVPFLVIDQELRGRENLLKPDGTLADIAPTILNLLDLPVPGEMTGSPLFIHPGRGSERVILLILDGWGVGEENDENPIKAAHTPTMDRITAAYPSTSLKASGRSVGLPERRSGNSETGHLTIAAGRVIEQDEIRINRAIRDIKGFSNNPVLKDEFARLNGGKNALHILGMLSESSSHGRIVEALLIARAAEFYNPGNIFLHLILDGRSTPPQGALKLLTKYQSDFQLYKNLSVVSAIGRGYALDRGGDYLNKTKLAYDVLVKGQGSCY